MGPSSLLDAFAAKVRIRGAHLACALLTGALLAGLVGAATANTFNVNSTDDALDFNPGNGVCETAQGNGVCTLRAAIQEANALGGADTINLQSNTTYTLTRVGSNDPLSGDLDVTESVVIVGAGRDSTIIDGNGDVTQNRVFYLHSCSCQPSVVVEMSCITIRNGKATGGGGIYSEVYLTLVNAVVSGNSAGNGGGILDDGHMTMVDSTVSDNSLTAVDGRGGGIYAVDNALIVTSTISGNHAVVGGGIYNQSTLIVVNSTISGNRSDDDGGGLYNASGTTSLFNVTIAANSANADQASESTYGGGIYNAGGTLGMIDSLVTNNAILGNAMMFGVLDDCSGTISSSGYNIVTHLFGCTILGPNLTSQPLLGPLQFNGGPTKTHALLSGSPGIDGGDPTGCYGATSQGLAVLTTDQRGQPRPDGVRCDIGAFEFQDLIFANDFEA